jgi:hypothetical protein
MGGEVEAAGDVLTGAIVGSAIEDNAGAPAHDSAHGACLNCKAPLNGAYCSTCGQRAHLHRSLVSLGHDILHGVFHFEGKIWHTLPELFFHPGRLTRRYIDGERVKFVSPMALYLFTVFLMFAVLSMTGGLLTGKETTFRVGDENVIVAKPGEWTSAMKGAKKENDRQLEALREELEEDEDLTPERRSDLQKQIADLETANEAMDAVATGQLGKLAELGKQSKENAAAAAGNATATEDSGSGGINLGVPKLDRRLNEGLKKINDNPQLLLYKLKTNGYKFSWALIPISVPFLWLIFFWRRDIHLYDHAIFVTYSISFMMLFLVLLSIGSALGLSAAIWGTALTFIPPIHIYKQLRGAYGVSRFGAFMRMMLLQISIVIVLTLFSTLLLILGALD